MRSRSTTVALNGLIVIAAAAAALAFSIPAFAQGTAPDAEPYWQQRADYEIAVNLDAQDHYLTGTETITYTNNSPDTLTLFYLHLYPNAFREKTSPLIRDFLQGTLHFFVGLPKSSRGWIDVTALAVGGDSVQFSVEGTILRSAFPKPLPPGGTVSIRIVFREKIMKRLGRSGYQGQHYDMAQWYPKMVVYDTHGWHPDQYRMGEFYGEFGTFDVRITLPEKFVVASTGVPVEGDPGWKKNPLRRGGGHPGGRPAHGAAASGTEAPSPPKTVRFRAENVHDFAWCADPSFIVQDTLVDDVRVMSFFRPWNRPWVDTTLVQGIRAVQWLGKTVGPYPYPQISIVDSPTHGGMEYPMLVMDGYVDEALVVHEVAHAYFYAALANDERAEAWLDEGFAQYMAFRYIEERYGPYGETEKRRFPHTIFPRHTMKHAYGKQLVRAYRTGYAERLATPVQDFQNGFSIGPYVKGPYFLSALQYAVGDSIFDDVLRTYYGRWKFKHVDEEAFRSVCNEISGKPLDEMFKQWVHTTKLADYKLSRFKVKSTPKGYDADVKIERKGELMMPLTLAFRLKNGNTVAERLDGESRTIEKTFSFDAKPVSAAINPDNEILDVHEIDNYSPRRRDFTLDVPFNTYYPRDAFSYRVLPIGYYNDVDGGKLGLRVRGSYDNYYDKFTVQGLYGFESETVDAYGSYERPLGYFGRDAAIKAEAFYREGRQGAQLDLTKIRRKSLYDPLAQHLSAFIGYRELTDTAYVFPDTYEEGKDIYAGVGLSMYPKTDIFETAASLSFAGSIWGSDFDYQKTTLSVKFRPGIRVPFPVKPYLRFFWGRTSVDPPLQTRFALAGASTYEKDKRFWLRSVGAFPKDYYNNFRVAGDANLRGYFDGVFAFKEIISSNVDVQIPFPLPLSRNMTRTLSPKLYVFYDWGKVLGERPLEGLPPAARGAFGENAFDGLLSDFGVGVSLWKLTAEFPLYLSTPKLVGEEDRWDFRWTIGFDRMF